MENIPPRGFRDVLPPSASELANLEQLSRLVFSLHGFAEARIPSVEDLQLYVKTTGDTSDIVQKEMYVLKSHQAADPNEERASANLALRPEGTPGVVRAYLNAGLHQTRPNQRFFYIGNMFRHERPQKGRYREFTQIGAEWLGAGSAASDAELIALVADILAGFDIQPKNYILKLNSIGDEQCRPTYRAKLLEFLSSVASTLCSDCQVRIGRNPMRVFDCKTDGPKVRRDAPKMAYCPECAIHYSTVKNLLTSNGIAFEEDPFLVRGLDYYTRTVFEFGVPALGAQNAIAAGGRYDGLVKQMGGPQMPASGWAIGAERVVLARQTLNPGAVYGHGARESVYVAVARPDEFAFNLIRKIRQAGIRTFSSAADRSMRWQLKEAENLKADWLVVLGDNELSSRQVAVKRSGENSQKLLSESEAIGFLKDNVKGKRLELWEPIP